MPDPALDQAMREAYASCKGTPLSTLEVRHPNFTQPIRIVLNGESMSARMEASAPLNPGQMVEFTACGIRFKRPDVSPGGVKEMEFEIDNVSREIGAALELAADSGIEAEITFREYLAEALADGPGNDPPMHLVLTRATAGVFSVQAAAGFPDLSSAEFPTDEYTLDRFPGLGA